MKRATKFELLRWTQKLSSSIPKRSVSRISFDAPLQEGALSKMRLLGRERGGDRLANWYTSWSFSEFADKACSLGNSCEEAARLNREKKGRNPLGRTEKLRERERESSNGGMIFLNSAQRGDAIFFEILKMLERHLSVRF